MSCSAPAAQVWPAATDARGFCRSLVDCSLRLPLADGLRSGTRLDWTFGGGLLALRCRTQVRHLEPGKRFVAVRVGGAFPLWVYERHVVTQGDTCTLEDRVTYEAPGWLLARWVDQRFVRQSLLELMESCMRATARLATFRTTPPHGEWLPGAAWETPGHRSHAVEPAWARAPRSA